MNIRKFFIKGKTLKSLYPFNYMGFSYGPFKQITFNSEFQKYLVDKRILMESVIKSFSLTYKMFLEAMQLKNLSNIEKITTQKFFEYSKVNFLNDYINNTNIRMELTNIKDFSLMIENLKNYHEIYGLDIKNQKNSINYGEQNLLPSTYLKKILFYNKNSLLKIKICPKIIVVDVIFNTNLKPIFYKKKGLKEELLFKSSVNTYEQYVWQFICYSKFKTYDVPFVINQKDLETLVGLKEIKQKENLNLISFFEKRQKKYENFGWKINNINNYMPSNYKYIAF